MVTQKVIDGVCRALADPTRRKILAALDGEPLAVLALAEQFPSLSRPAVSKHLRVLREAGLVEERRDGRQRLYRRVSEPLRTLAAWLTAMTGGAAGAGSRAAGSSLGPTVRPRVDAGDWRCW